ncbi:peptidoglycan-binding protein [Streptomyces sp. NPDC001339]|uniref:peptidoglycan-binding domain-containing protein n=1 Tax=Streptomyces sp. NPDC001339 TaxID=3364563 RepID=UPI0036B3790F
MPSLLALTDGPEARDRLLETAGAAESVLAVGERVVIIEDPALTADDLRVQPGVLAAADETMAATTAVGVDALVGDETAAVAALAELLGLEPSVLDEVETMDMVGWLTAINPTFAAEVDAPTGDGEPWDFPGSCVSRVQPPLPSRPPNSPLRAARFAGDPELEQCLLGQHRMMEPEESRAVLKVQAALLDLGFELPEFGADGRFGPETGRAVSAFKRAQGITPSDPVVGKKTMARLDELFADEA